MDRGEHARIEQLSDEECWRLLADSPVGRVGLIVDDAPEIYPVNHLVDNGTIVFRSDPGTKLAGLARHRRCASRSTASIPSSASGGACW